jgi:DNA-binding MarR family transcriptional regulator
VHSNPNNSENELDGRVDAVSRYARTGRYLCCRERRHSAADDADIVDFLGAVMDVQRFISMLTMPVARDHSISERALGIIFLVHAGVDRPGALSEYLDVLPSTITSDIDKLVAAGLLRRTATTADRRVTRIEVTPKGAAVQQKSLQQLQEFFRAKVAGVALDELHACIATPGNSAVFPSRPFPIRCVGAAPADLLDPADDRSAARSPIIIDAAFVLPPTMFGMIDASATRSPATPRTRSVGSTTARSSVPIRHVPTGWYTPDALRRTNSARSGPWRSEPGNISRPTCDAIAGWAIVALTSSMPATRVARSRGSAR